MKKLLIALMFFSAIPAMAKGLNKYDIGMSLALIRVAPEICGTSRVDHDAVIDAIERVRRMMNWDMADLEEIAANAFPQSVQQTMRDTPALAIAVARSQGTCDAVDGLIESSKYLNSVAE